MQMWLVASIVVVVCVLFIVVPFYLMRRSHTLRMREFQLHAPLLNSDDHRLDAALREAEEGFNVCTACGFDNFKRSTFCTICGEAIEDPTRVVDPKRRKQLKKEEKKRSKPKLQSEAVDVRAAARLLDQQVARGRRQRRARKRKEWQRQLDVGGDMYWYRAGTGVELKKYRFPGYVFQVQTKECDVMRTDGPRELSTDPSAEVSTIEPSTEPRTMVERAASLARECETIKFDLVEAADADPTRLPMAPGSLSSAQKTDVITMFERDFPTKYAQFVTSTSGLLLPAEIAHLRLNVNRERIYEESIESFSVIHQKHLRSVMRINFLEESGIDAGGVHREWFVLFIEKIVEPETGLFKCMDRTEQTYYLNPHSQHDIGENHLMYFFATGRLLGRALLEGDVTGFHLSLPLLKIILGLPLSFSDLEFFDPEAFKNLVWMLEHEGVDQLGLDFSVTEQTLKGMVTTDLIPDGRNIAVTDENKMLYLERKFKYLLFESVSSQLYALLKGIYEVIPQELLMVFDPEELDYVLCGSDEIDVDDWERNTKYTEDLHGHPALIWFWELVREMPNEYRRRLLLFATGSSRVPLAGFCALTSYDGRLCPFTLKGTKLLEEGYLVGHACFNRIDLPRHVVREELKTVLYATLDTELYGFTTD